MPNEVPLPSVLSSSPITEGIKARSGGLTSTPNIDKGKKIASPPASKKALVRPVSQ